jgi:hypothetical protein
LIQEAMPSPAYQSSEPVQQTSICQSSSTQKNGKLIGQIPDNRPVAIAQRQLQAAANSGQKATYLAQLQGIANASAPVAQLARIKVPRFLQNPLPAVFDTEECDEQQMNALIDSIDDMSENPRGAGQQARKTYQRLLLNLRLRISRALRSGDYKNGVPRKNFLRPPKPWRAAADKHWLRGDDLKTKRKLVGMVKTVVDLAAAMPDQLTSLMSHDDIFNMTPEAQLEYCVDTSKGYDAGTLAKCLYTCYFYEPINKYLRGLLPETVNPKILNLITETLAALQRVVEDDRVVHEIDALRVECKAGWIGNKREGDVLDFPGYTSAHPSVEGMAKMLDDIGNGVFGAVERLAVLKFEGRSKILQPDTRYFPEEVEIIIPAGMKAKVVRVEKIRLNIPGTEEVDAMQYTLEIPNPHEAEVEV